MVFLGLERPVDYGRQQIFDPSTAQMVLEAQRQYANAVYNDYQQGIQEMKDFNKEFGTFQTPILEDQAWWNQNVTDPVRKLINEAYANGVDLLRSPQGRALISQMIINRPYGDMASVRQSAENAKEYLKERAKLEAAGLYNPMTEKYAGPGLDTFSTLDNGVWNRMSPVPYQNMSDFSKSYFDNISPVQRQATKNGVTYTISEITEPMLQDIANRHFNDLVNTPQGQLMYKMYKDQLGSDELARQAFNDAVVSGNLDRKKYADDYDKMELENKKLAIDRAKVAVARERLQMAKDAREKAEKERANGWTFRQMVNIMNNGRKGMDLSSAEGNKGIKTSDREKFAYNYSAYQTKLVPGSLDMMTARALLSGQTALDVLNDTDDVKGVKRRSVSFSTGSGIDFTQHRQYTYGRRELTDNSVTNRLRRHMAKKGISGYIVNDDDISVNLMDYSEDGHLWDINGYVRVKYSDISDFDGNLDNALKYIGATKKNINVKKQTSRGSYKYEPETFVDIPISRTIDSRGFSDSQINELSDALNYTRTIAAKRQAGYEEDDMDDLID